MAGNTRSRKISVTTHDHLQDPGVGASHDADSRREEDDKEKPKSPLTRLSMSRIREEVEQKMLKSLDIEPDGTRTGDVSTTRIILRRLTVNTLFIGLWYAMALLLSLYNKWMFSPEHLDFHFPLLVTALHMIVQFALANVVLFSFPRLRPPKDHLMSWKFYATRIGPCGAATGLDIGLGNASLQFITLAFYKQPTFQLIGVITLMTAGVVMMVASETEFVLIGFGLVITASALSGLRWSLTQMLLLRNPATSNPFSSIYYLAPIMFVSLMACAVPAEGFTAFFSAPLWQDKGIVKSTVLILFPGFLAFAMTVAEFSLLKRTSVVTLGIAGIFKEVVTISASAATFGDILTPINVTGLCITIVAIAAYNYMRFRKLREEVEARAAGEDGIRYTRLREDHPQDLELGIFGQEADADESRVLNSQ